MTDITDQDRRDAREWATMMEAQHAGYPNAFVAARVILATVDAPAPTLAEEVKMGLLFRVSDTDAEAIRDALDLADRVEKLENEHSVYATRLSDIIDENARLTAERDEARAEVVKKEDEAVAECHRAYRERDEARAEVIEGKRRTDRARAKAEHLKTDLDWSADSSDPRRNHD